MSDGTRLGALDGDLMEKFEQERDWCVRWSAPGKFLNESPVGKVNSVLVRITLDGAGLGKLDRFLHGNSD